MGWTPLHHACHAGRLAAVELLVGAGAETDVAALNGGTPLMTAIDSRAHGCVEYLVNAGADVLAQTKHGSHKHKHTIPSAPRNPGAFTFFKPYCTFCFTLLFRPTFAPFICALFRIYLLLF